MQRCQHIESVGDYELWKTADRWVIKDGDGRVLLTQSRFLAPEFDLDLVRKWGWTAAKGYIGRSQVGDTDEMLTKITRALYGPAVQAAMSLERVWKVDVGETTKYGDWIVLRIKKTDGKWKDFKKIGKAPEGYKKGDPIPEQYKAALESAKAELGKQPDKPEQETPPAAEPAKPEEEKPAAPAGKIIPQSNKDAAKDALKNIVTGPYQVLSDEEKKEIDDISKKLWEADWGPAHQAAAEMLAGKIKEDNPTIDQEDAMDAAEDIVKKHSYSYDLGMMMVLDKKEKGEAEAPEADLDKFQKKQKYKNDLLALEGPAYMAHLDTTAHEYAKKHGIEQDEARTILSEMPLDVYVQQAMALGVKVGGEEGTKPAAGQKPKPAGDPLKPPPTNLFYSLPKKYQSMATQAMQNVEAAQWGEDFPEELIAVQGYVADELMAQGMSEDESMEAATEAVANWSGEQIGLKLAQEKMKEDMGEAKPEPSPEPEKAPKPTKIEQSPQAKAAKATLDKPQALPKYDEVQGQNIGGSTGAKLIQYEDPDNPGQMIKGVMKAGGSEGHAKEEHQTNAIYAALGVPVPKTTLHEGGVMISQFLEGTTRADQLGAEDQAKVRDSLKKNFAVDALLGNWDVTGAGFDNVMWDNKTNTAYRIDNGGSLRYRAQGAKKAPEQFGDTVTELDTMRDPAKLAGKLAFSTLTDDEVVNQIGQVLTNKQAILNAVADGDDDLRAKLDKRINSMASWANAKQQEKAGGGKKPQGPKSQAEEAKHGKVVHHPDGYPPIRLNQRDAFLDYQGSGYTQLNKQLREGAGMEPKQKRMAEQLDSYMKQLPTVDDVGTTYGGDQGSLWRGTGTSMLKNLFKGMALPAFSLNTMGDLDKPNAKGHTPRQMLQKILTGTTVMDQGFVSCSRRESVARNFTHGKSDGISNQGGAVVMKIKGPSQACDLNKATGIGKLSEEHEVLMPRGTAFRIKNVDFKAGANGRPYFVLEMETVGGAHEYQF